MTALPPPAPLVPALDPEIFEGLLELADGDDASFVVELFGSYVASHRESVQGMREALAADDADALGRHAHTLKGASANVGAHHVATLSRDLQEMGESGSIAVAAAWIDAIDAEFDRVLDEVARRLPAFSQTV